MPKAFPKVAGTILLMLLVTGSSFSQQSAAPPTNPCAAVELRQFDFWVGEWDLTWPGQKPGESGHGTNTIKRILDGCVVQETFSGGKAHLRGTSVSTFDHSAGGWKQTWVDNEGGYLDFRGELKDGQMMLQREAVLKNGTKSLQRTVWKTSPPTSSIGVENLRAIAAKPGKCSGRFTTSEKADEEFSDSLELFSHL